MGGLDGTEFYRALIEGVYGARQGGARIIIDAENSATGVGKTSLAVALSRYLAQDFGFDLSNDDVTLSAQEYVQRYRDHPGTAQPSVLILDELSGGGAADARRAMSTSNTTLARGWETMRTKRIVSITTLPHWSYADAKLRSLADYRLVCQQSPIGTFRAYQIGADFDDGTTETYRLDRGEALTFPDMTEDALHRHLADQKDELLAAESMDADDALMATDGGETQDPKDVRRDEKADTAQRLRDTTDMTLVEIGEAVGRSKSWVSLNTDPDNAD